MSLPLYEFECKCGEKFEAFKSIDDRHNANCPKCGNLVKKVMSAANFSVGWRLTERSHTRFGPRDEYEKDV